MDFKPIGHSGGAKGSDKYWTDQLRKVDITVNNHYTKNFETPHGDFMSDPNINSLKIINKDLKKTAKTLYRNYPTRNKYINNLLIRNWLINYYTDSVYAIGTFNKNNIISGGTSWVCELAKEADKPVYFFDQDKNDWYLYRKSNTLLEPRFLLYDDIPKIITKNFACIGTRKINQNGKNAIKDLINANFKKTS
jgi:hypothetical protein